MKKRIISLILVIVIAGLSLVSCGYSLAKDDLSAYATLKDKKAFEDAWKKLVIEDGDFTADEELRNKKVIDSIYADLAAAIKNDGEKKTEGKLSGHDILYYCYYATAEIDGKTVAFFNTNMKTSSTVSVQLGLGDPSGVEKGVADIIKDVDLKDKVYTTETSGTVKEGDVVYISYTYTHQIEVKDEETGETAKKDETVKVTSERLVLTKDASPFVNFILEKKAGIGVTISDDFDDDQKSYTGIKVEWRANGDAIGSFKDVTYTEKKEVADVTGTKHDLKDKELTYYIYPVHYMSVPEFTAENLVNEILSSNITIDSMTSILFGKDWDDKTDDEKKTLLDEYKTKDKDGKDVSLEDFITELAKIQKDFASAETALDKADEDLEEKKTAYDDAKAKYEADKTDAKKETYEKADVNYQTAQKTQKDAKNKYDETLEDRDDKVAALLAIKADMSEKMTKGYEKATYNYLLDTYNNEIKMSLAEEIYALFEEHVELKSVPEKAVDATFDQLIQNYKHEFNTGEYDTDKHISNYAQYKGSFKSYLVDEGKKLDSSVKTYDEALAAVRAKAEEYVKPVVRIYVIANAFGIVATDEEFKEYKENVDNNYSYNEYTYGENSVLYAYQFDKLMDFILESEEQDDGSFDYKKVEFTFGEKTDDDADNED